MSEKTKRLWQVSATIHAFVLAEDREQAMEVGRDGLENEAQNWLELDKATCVGAYENRTNVGFACDEHCGHGNEDGWCMDLPRYFGARSEENEARAALSSGLKGEGG